MGLLSLSLSLLLFPYSFSNTTRLSADPQGVPIKGIDVGELRKERRRAVFDYPGRVDTGALRITFPVVTDFAESFERPGFSGL